jgi:dTDP-4-amino-4,6-dideoxygalactose transaminase
MIRANFEGSKKQFGDSSELIKLRVLGDNPGRARMAEVVKEKLADLAICGGTPAFESPLHVGAPNIGDRDKLRERFDDILDRRWLTNGGPYVQAFEERVAKMVGVPHCIATCNGTLALEIAVRALGLSGEVILPSFTFVATAHALQWQEITPVFCDIDPQTCNIDPARVAEMITPRTTGIIGVHLWGRPCDTQALVELAREHDLRLLYDASHAFGCTHLGRAIGSFGDAEVFSFHATKFINTIEGGAILTKNDDLAEKARLMRNFGFVNYDNVTHVGTNGKMNEFAAAMGLTSIEELARFIEINKTNYHLYGAGLAEIKGLRVMPYAEHEKGNYQYVVVDVDQDVAGIDRDQLVQVLAAENVLARRYFHPGCHRMEPYRSYFPHAGLLLPVTERQSTRVLSLPTGSAVGEREIDMICRIIATAVAHSAAINTRLRQEIVVARIGTYRHRVA